MGPDTVSGTPRCPLREMEQVKNGEAVHIKNSRQTAGRRKDKDIKGSGQDYEKADLEGEDVKEIGRTSGM